MEWVLGVIMGVALAAACGFRVFIPMLVMSIAAHTGHLEPVAGFQWIGSWPCLVCFIIATVVETLAYFIPVVSNGLDTIATPAASAAGTILVASLIGDISPVLRWILAAIAGGAVAGSVQLTTVAARSVITPVGGSGVIAVLEDGAAVVTSVLAVVAPIMAILLIMVMAYLFLRRKQKLRLGI
ncbi:hypothetical protein CSA37_07005 [Candidatus Fermentibacteria bacterium]|nr:MAG: hypothetical protein CSA37_09900 [Candidatus Fermentibacteria bacterium]PIE52308.1 MAG: hypothetical protein CSA37_07005 [Candidatus Fermentibacteria bacterium]